MRRGTTLFRLAYSAGPHWPRCNGRSRPGIDLDVAQAFLQEALGGNSMRSCGLLTPPAGSLNVTDRFYWAPFPAFTYLFVRYPVYHACQGRAPAADALKLY